MKKLFYTILAVVALGTVIACSSKDHEETATPASEEEGVDSMVYGLVCDGTNDSVIVLLKFTGEDPVTYNIETAKVAGKVIGQMQIGDWIGLLPNPQDTTEATMAVDLDQLKGTWTYQVLPTWKDASKMSARALRNKMAEMPDSLRQAYLVPREYGFTLKRSSVASPVGFVMRTHSLEDDSPVEYPAVKNYTKWKCRNGKLILTSTDRSALVASAKEEDASAKEIKAPKETKDTLFFVMMTQDSLILVNTRGEYLNMHRQENALSANAAANKAEVTKGSTKEIKE